MQESIKELRKEKGITQDELATRVGVKRSVISKYESGLITPSILVLEKIAKEIEVDISCLLSKLPPEKLKAIVGETDELFGALRAGIADTGDRLLKFHQIFESYGITEKEFRSFRIELGVLLAKYNLTLEQSYEIIDAIESLSPNE